MNTVATRERNPRHGSHCDQPVYLRGELKLQSYTLESCAHAVLRRRLPYFPAKTLARWAEATGHRSRPGIAHQRWRQYGDF